MLGKNICKTDRTTKDELGRNRFARCTNGGEPLAADDPTNDTTADEPIVPSAKYVVPKVAISSATRPVAYDWLLPDKHGANTKASSPAISCLELPISEMFQRPAPPHPP